MRILAAGLALALGFQVTLVGRAMAGDGQGQVTPGATSWTAQVEDAEEPGAVGVEQASSVGTPIVGYDYLQACQRGEGISGDGYYGCGGSIDCPNGVASWVWSVHFDGSRTYLGAHCFEPDEVPTPAAVTPGLALRAFERVPLPDSEVVVQPPGGETLVNLDTVFSTRADGFTETVRLLGRRVELDIWASEFRWVSGDGTTMRTDWAGRPWRKGTPMTRLITHRYEAAAKGLRVRVDTTWSARFRVDGGPWRDVPGTVTIEGESFDLAVRSAAPYLAG